MATTSVSEETMSVETAVTTGEDSISNDTVSAPPAETVSAPPTEIISAQPAAKLLFKMATASLSEEPMSVETAVTTGEDDSINTDIVSAPPAETISAPPTEIISAPQTETVSPPPAETVSVPPSETISTQPTETISDILNTREWLDGQLYDQLSHIGADKVEVPLTKDVETARARVSKLQEELLRESSRLSVKEQTLKRLQLGVALTKELFVNNDTEGNNSHKKDLEERVLKQSKLVSDILKEAAELETLRTDLKNLRDKNFEMKARNRQSMYQIRQRQNLLEQKAEDFRKDKDGQRKKEQLEDEIKKIVILRHTLQGLILGSGINWAEDPAMEELLLSLGEPLTF